MGDRTTVTLAFLQSQQDEALKHFDQVASEAEIVDDLAYHSFYEINYGNLEFLDALQAAGIAYDSTWDSGSGFDSGTRSCRFMPDGTAVIKEIYESENNPNLGALLSRIDDLLALRQFILEYHQKISVLPWDNQEEYGKRHQITQLISPT